MIAVFHHLAWSIEHLHRGAPKDLVAFVLSLIHR